MLSELSALLAASQVSTPREEYDHLTLEENVLGKRTQDGRKGTLKRLRQLFVLDPGSQGFLLFRRLWSLDSKAQPVLALSLALARDPVLRASWPFVLRVPLGANVSREELIRFLRPMKLVNKPTTELSMAQNILSSWAQAGFLSGKLQKTRIQATITPVNLVFCLALGTFQGLTGRMLLQSEWVQALGLLDSGIETLTRKAAAMGLLSYKTAGDLVEISINMWES